jgi:hypothetical protein
VTIDPTELQHTLKESCNAGLSLRIAFSEGHQDANAPHPVGLFRVRSKWPRCHPGAD